MIPTGEGISDGVRAGAAIIALILMLASTTLPGCSSHKHRQIPGESFDVDLSKDSDAKLISEGDLLQYPWKAGREKVTGYVEVTFIVAKTGQPREITILKDEPPGYGFAGAAVQQVSSLKFQPAVLNGARVRQRMKRRYNFE